MYITEKNLRIADGIVGIFIAEKCTISETEDILYSILRDIRASSMVQMKESYSERFSDALED